MGALAYGVRNTGPSDGISMVAFEQLRRNAERQLTDGPLASSWSASGSFGETGRRNHMRLVAGRTYPKERIAKPEEKA
jgi:hypothetical protein